MFREGLVVSLMNTGVVPVILIELCRFQTNACEKRYVKQGFWLIEVKRHEDAAEICCISHKEGIL